MLHEDRVTFAVLMCRIYLKGLTGEHEYEQEFNYFLRSGQAVVTDTTAKMDGMTTEQTAAMESLVKLPAFKDLTSYVRGKRDFFTWLNGVSPENDIPECWKAETKLSPIGITVHQLLVIQAFRPDKLLAMASKVVAGILGTEFTHHAEQELDLASVIEKEVKASTPVLLCSVPGYDASGRVDDLATQQNKQITSIAIGSAEGFSLADKAINSAVKSGRWVMLKNVHLAPQWLVTLEKKLHTLQPHTTFRLFLTMEINLKVPVNLLRVGRIFVFEPPPGIKANLLRTYSTVSPERMRRAPNERARLYFLLAWFHAIVQERLRYAPLGWSKVYEFSESDLRVACDTLDTWLDNVAQGRTNISPDKVPWDALRALLSQAIYGGRIDNDFDQRLLSSFVERLFTIKSFDADFPLVLDLDGNKGSHITIPEGTRREQFLQWIENLPENQTPSWLGLPNNAEKVLLTTLGQNMIAKLLKMQMLSDEDELAYSPESGKNIPEPFEVELVTGVAKRKDIDHRPAWMRALLATSTQWLAILPEMLSSLKRTADNIKDPLFRFFEREVNTGIKLLETVRQDLSDVIQICEGTKRPTNYLRILMSDLAKGILPSNWRRYRVPQGLTVLQWVVDFSDRVKQLQRVSQAAITGRASDLKNLRVWLGGLFVPEAFITASRQYVAQANNWSLEELTLEVTISDGPNGNLQMDECSFAITGLKLQGADCKKNKLQLTSTITTDLPLTRIRWSRTDPQAPAVTDEVTLPVYLNQSRAELLFTVDMAVTGADGLRFYERGIAFNVSSLSG